MSMKPSQGDQVWSIELHGINPITDRYEKLSTKPAGNIPELSGIRSKE